MKHIFLKSYILLGLLNCLGISVFGNPQIDIASRTHFEKTTTFFPGWEALNQQHVEWYFLEVPENWDQPISNKVKLGVAVLKSWNPKNSKKPVVFIQGGPGGGVIGTIWKWVNHPLRNDRDIILIDLRGTGFSQPKLCPDLGKAYLQIIAKNLSAKEEINQRITAAMACKDSLEKRGIDIHAYNSKFIANDLNALKQSLGYVTWNVYGISYGTRVALEYVRRFEADIQSLILDSVVPPNAPYYSQNTKNYREALQVLFNKCAQDEACATNYGDLSSVYSATIKKLKETPLIVPVNNSLSKNKQFVFNEQDMMIAVHQGLYHRKLFEVLPLMLQEFNSGNKDMISALLESLANRLSLDYGTYYCMSCNETIPFNNLEVYKKESQKYTNLSEGLSFYRAEFSICEKWNNQSKDTTITQAVISDIPTLIFGGEFDPITPAIYGKLAGKTLSNSFYIEAPAQGHAASFIPCGQETVATFLNAPSYRPKTTCFTNEKKVYFAHDIYINAGVFKLATMLRKPNISFLLPLVIVLLLLTLSLLFWGVQSIIYKLKKTPKFSYKVKVTRRIISISVLLMLTALCGIIIGISQTSVQNYFILAFGLPSQFSIFFILPYLGIFCSILIIYLQSKWHKHFLIKQKTHYYVLILSLFIVVGYLIKVGILPTV